MQKMLPFSNFAMGFGLSEAILYRGLVCGLAFSLVVVAPVRAEVVGLQPNSSATLQLPGGSLVAWGARQHLNTSVKLVELAFGGFDDSFLIGVLSDGRFLTAGENLEGRLTPPPGIGQRVKRLAAGDAHVVALLDDGSVVAWGRNTSGQSTVPVNIGACKAVAAGLNFSAAVRADGTVVVWGSPQHGVQAVPSNATNVKSLSAASFANHILALKEDGTVVAWGRNDQGQCAVPVGLSGVVEVAAGGQGEEGDDFSLALTSQGRVIAWGSNKNGQRKVPAKLKKAKSIAAGDDYGIALRPDGTLIGWGEVPPFGPSLRASRIFAGNGEGAIATLNGYFMPFEDLDTMAKEDLSGIVQISAGYDGNCVALRNDGRVVAWGRNDERQSRVPAGLSGVVMVSAGDDYALALRSNGKIVYWGGDGGVRKMPPSLEDIASISAGNDFALAIKRSSGEVVQWGVGLSSSPPEALRQIKAVSAGNRHALALKSDGTVVAWGRNDDGQCNVPPGLKEVIGIAAASNFSLALKSDGTVVGWGNLSHAAVPPELADPATAKVKQISAHDNHALALREDRTVVAWGPPGPALFVPSGLRNVRSVAAGGDVSLALVGDGRRAQQISIALPRTLIFGGKYVIRSKSTSRLPIRYSVSDSSVASIEGNRLTVLKALPFTVTAHQDGNDFWLPAQSDELAVNPTKQPQRIAFTAKSSVAAGEVFNLLVTTRSGLPVKITSSDSSVVRVDGFTATALSKGNATLTATQDGNENYAPALPVRKSVTVN